MVCKVLQHLQLGFRMNTTLLKLLCCDNCDAKFNLPDSRMMNKIQQFITLFAYKFPFRFASAFDAPHQMRLCTFTSKIHVEKFIFKKTMVELAQVCHVESLIIL